MAERYCQVVLVRLEELIGVAAISFVCLFVCLFVRVKGEREWDGRERRRVKFIKGVRECVLDGKIRRNSAVY